MASPGLMLPWFHWVHEEKRKVLGHGCVSSPQELLGVSFPVSADTSLARSLEGWVSGDACVASRSAGKPQPLGRLPGMHSAGGEV